VLESELVADLLTGIVERGLHERASVIVSGFLGRVETAWAVAEFVGRAKSANPRLVYACDPVMGDADLGFFTEEPLHNAFSQDVVPLADVILPNAFELSALSGLAVAGREDVARARESLRCPAVVATSVPVANRPDLLSRPGRPEAAILAKLKNEC
jgi:pyridoxine kinase